MQDDELIYLTDDTGSETPFEIVDTLELNGRVYALLAPADDADGGVLIFEIIEDDGEETFDQVEDEDLIQRVFDVYRSSDEDYEFCDAE